jgi:hypothetical protein
VVNISLGTASLVEVLWTLVALPGLVLWGVNTRSAVLTIRAAKLAGISNGRMEWARFGLLLTSCFMFVEFVFLATGVIAMLRPSNPDGVTVYNLVFAGIFMLASIIVTFVGKEWRRVDRYLVAAARLRSEAIE